MQSHLLLFIAILSVGLSILTPVPTRSAEMGMDMADPLFGLDYSPAKVHFETAPRVIGQKCARLRGRGLWVYGEWQGTGATYWIVSGFLSGEPDPTKGGARDIEPDPEGVLVEIRGTECRHGTPAMILKGKRSRSRKDKPVDISQEAMDGLVSDALRRYVTAFGSKENLLNELKRQHADLTNLPPVVRTHLDELSK